MTSNSNSSVNTSTGRKGRRKPAASVPEIISVNEQPQEPQPQEPQQEDAYQAPTDAPAPADKAALLAMLRCEIAEATSKPDVGSTGPYRKSSEQIRCNWSESVMDAASDAAVRLPGLFPVRGTGPKAAMALGVPAAFCYKLEKSAPAIPSRPGDVALKGLYRASARLANGEKLTVEWLLVLVQAIRLECTARDRKQPDWLDNLAVTDGMKNMEGIGLQTSLIYQLAKQTGMAVAITPDEWITTVKLPKV